ncbi:MAG TPA: choice-of-anchor D domain-containing protein [Candidatus Aquilonibacter sp.]|nr:choice-of-anchor D domain-containing protein [Candidatus Aquilonibacter sp.]
MRRAKTHREGVAFKRRANSSQGAVLVTGLLVLLAAMSLASCAGYTTNASSGSGSGAGSSGGGVLTASPTSVSFGDVAVGANATQSITVTNTGTGTVNISGATVSGGVFAVVGGDPSSSIAVGKSATVQVEFAPTSMTPATGALTIASNATNSSLAIALTGTGLEAIPSFSPASLNFNNVTVGQTSSQSVTLSNSGNTNLSLSAASISGTGLSMSGLAIPATITPNTSATFSVQFTPQSTAGVSGSIRFTDNAQDSPQTLTITGSAVAAGSTLTANPGSFNFNDVQVGNSSTQTFTLTNSGTSTITLDSIAASGAGFSVSGITSGQTIAGGGSTTLTGQFAPSVAGAASGTITVTSTAANSPLVIALSGTGTQAALTANPSSINFGSILDGSSASVNVTLKNSGTANLSITQAAASGAGFSMGALAPQTLTPGATATFAATFAPTTSGNASGSVSVTSSAPGSPLVIALSGTGTAAQPQLSISPSPVAFGNVNVGSNATQTVTLTNPGNATLNITATTITGTGYTMNLQPTSIGAGGNSTFTVAFTPTASGSASGSVSITSNAPGSPATIALSGTGLQAEIAATPSSVAFGTVTIGNTNSQPITLKNNGNSTLTFSQISVTGAGFSQTGLTTSTTIAAGGSSTFNATFDPSSTGAANGSINLTTNGTPSSLVINLSGTGQTGTSAPTITSATTSSGTVGTAFSYQIVATNTPTSYGATGLPTGLSINTSTGLISGTPTSAGTSSVTLSATNSTGTGNATLTLTIAIAAPAITSATAANGTVGTAFSYQIAATNSPTSYGATGLPAGLSVNSSTGLISGTPTAAGTFSVTLSATDSTGTGNATLTLTIASGPQLSVNPTSLAFGNVNVGSNSSKTVTLTNSGGATLNITAATISGAGYTMSLQPTSIGAGANTIFTVTFIPTTGGSASGSVSITSNAPGSPTTISLGGTGLQAQISANPSSAAFGTVTEGTTDSVPVTLTNNGNTTLTFSQISVTGTGFGQTGLTTSTTIAAGGNVSFNATFDPSSTTAVNGSITLTTDGTPSPLTISLSGTGQASTLLLGASPTSLAFGNVLDQSSSQLTTSVTNNGNSNVTISGVSVTGAGFSASGISNGTVLTPGQSVTLTVTFAPASGGAVSGSVSIASNATDSPAGVSLSGTGMHSVVLSWDASPTNGVTYNVFRGTSSGGEGTTAINPSPITSLSYTDTNVTPGTDYYYTVEAVDSGGSSAPSNEAVADVPNP